MGLEKGFESLAKLLQEAALSHGNVRSMLSAAVSAAHQGTGKYAYMIDHTGDGESGDVIYDCDGDTMSAPYSIGTVGGKSNTHIDTESARKVVPMVSYMDAADDDDHYTAQESAGLYLGGGAKIAERFISKGERDKADAGDFAGKGKSFPILKPEDVSAAVHAIGRAGPSNHGPSTIKARIIAIAKRKGWTSHLPKSWQGGDEDKTESAVIEITGDVIPLKEGAVGQDGTAYLKLIAPGRGSSGWYPQEVLERDGPKVFAKGTKNFWNHQTEAEEAARPEGDLRDLASVLTEDAHFEQTGPAGPGLYAKAKVFEQFRQPVDDLAKHIGMSIRATGKAKEGKAPDGKTGPIIEQLTRGISVDYVTTPGAGGQILQLFEAARGRQIQLQEGADDMDAAELKRLQESNRKLAQRLARSEAREAATAMLEPISLPRATKSAIIERAVPNAPITADGEFDAAGFKTLMEAEITYAANLLPGGVRIQGMGTVDPKITEAQRAEADKQWAETYDGTLKEMAKWFMGEGETNKARRKAFREGRAAA